MSELISEELENQSPSESIIQEEGFDQESYPTSVSEKDILEDQNDFFSNTFKKNTFLNEKWDNELIVDGVISNIGDDVIHVNCLVDEINNVFKEKIFPMSLVNHINQLELDKFLRVKISFKPGSMRYDIYDGKGFNINKEAFQANEIWDSLEDFKFDDPE